MCTNERVGICVRYGRQMVWEMSNGRKVRRRLFSHLIEIIIRFKIIIISNKNILN